LRWGVLGCRRGKATLQVVSVGGLGSTEFSTAAKNSRTSTTPSSRVGDRLSGRT
jgi:hypothetical protein